MFNSCVADKNRGVGFLKYWTVSNIPLFLLAAPMLYIMAHSALKAWSRGLAASQDGRNSPERKGDVKAPDREGFTSVTFLDPDIVRRLSLVQLVLTILAFTSYHVQIITRLSSGYPVWCWWLASLILDHKKIRIFGRRWRCARIVSGWMVGYALIQGGLFASFLPPA